MRPLPSEVISGIRALLAETIAPELSSEHARSRLQEVRAVLAQIDWDNAGFDLAHRCDVLGDALRAAERWNTEALPERPQAARLEDYQRYHDALSAMAARTLATLREPLATSPDDSDVAVAYRRVLGAV